MLLAPRSFSTLRAAALVSHPHGHARMSWNFESSIITNFRGVLILPQLNMPPARLWRTLCKRIPVTLSMTPQPLNDPWDIIPYKWQPWSCLAVLSARKLLSISLLSKAFYVPPSSSQKNQNSIASWGKNHWGNKFLILFQEGLKICAFDLGKCSMTETDCYLG